MVWLREIKSDGGEGVCVSVANLALLAKDLLVGHLALSPREVLGLQYSFYYYVNFVLKLGSIASSTDCSAGMLQPYSKQTPLHAVCTRRGAEPALCTE